MNVIIYIIFFIIGILFGSFFSLAIYRIPLHQDITHKRSYCPNCNHKLKFLDLIPILSYIFLKGKCRYCGKKIKNRYLLLEIISGIVFVFFAISLKINIYNLEIQKLIYLLIGILYISTLFIIAGIEKETHTITKPVIIFGLILQTIYIIYLYILKVSIYKYIIYLIAMLILILIDTILLRKRAKINYTIQILTLVVYLVLLTNEEIVILSVIFTLLMIAIKEMITKRKKNINEIIDNNIEKKVPIGYYLCCSNIIIIIISNFLIL